MEDIIKLNSHDGTNNYLKKINIGPREGRQAYVLNTPYDFLRSGEIGDGRPFVDPSGGPMLVQGDILNDKYIIDRVGHFPYIGTIIILEKKK